MPYTPYTVEEVQERIRTLENGLVQVMRGVNFADRGVTYNSASELRERINYFQQLLLVVTTGRPKQSIGVMSKGLS